MNKSDNMSNIEYSIQTESITTKIKAIEHQKLKILDNANSLIQSMGGENPSEAEAVGETIASLILTSYRLGINLGITTDDMDRRILSQLNAISHIEGNGIKRDLHELKKKYNKNI